MVTKLTRRDFLRIAGVGTAAAALCEIGPRAPLLRALGPDEQVAAQKMLEFWKTRDLNAFTGNNTN